MTPMLRAVSLSLSVGTRGTAPRPLIRDLSFEVGSASIVALVGRSGSGKSSVLKMCAGLMTPDSGSVSWEGQDITRWNANKRARWRRRHAGYLDQDARMIDELTLMENALLPAKRADKAMLARASALFSELAIEHVARARPGSCSGGERQRAGVARSLVAQPPVVLLDEPTASLDVASAELVMAALRRHRDAGSTILVATHDDLVLGSADERVRIGP